MKIKQQIVITTTDSEEYAYMLSMLKSAKIGWGKRSKTTNANVGSNDGDDDSDDAVVAPSTNIRFLKMRAKTVQLLNEQKLYTIQDVLQLGRYVLAEMPGFGAFRIKEITKALNASGFNSAGFVLE